jgi:hypothetical protein
VPLAAIGVAFAVAMGGAPEGSVLPSTPGSVAPTTAISMAPSDPSDPSDPTGAYLIDQQELERRGRLAADGQEPYATALTDLMLWADDAVDEVPQPVQPLVIEGTEGPFVDDASRAYGLGLAYSLTGEERYATAARATVRAWMDTARTTADTCTDHGGCNTSLMLGRAAPGFVFGAALIAESPSWTDEDRAALEAWMHDVLLPAASARPNNWGDAGNFLRVVAADYSGDQEAWDAAIATWKAFIDLIEPDGRIPEEARRGRSGIAYTQEALQYKVAVAVIAERRGVDLWDHVGAQGASLRTAIDRLAYFWTRPQEWPDHEDPRVPSTGPFWEIVYGRWRDPLWVDIVADGRPYGDEGHSAVRWTTLTHGVPIGTEGGASGPPSSQPAPSSTPIASGTARPTASPSASGSGVPGPPVEGFAGRLASAFGQEVPVRLRWDRLPAAATVELERSVEGRDWTRLEVAANERVTTVRVPIGETHRYRIRAVLEGRPGSWSALERVRVRRLEPSEGRTELRGRWTRVDFARYSDGWARSTDEDGAVMRWELEARSVAVVGPMGPTRGRIRIEAPGIDTQTIDLGRLEYVPRVLLAILRWDDGGPREIRFVANAAGSRRTVAIDDLVVLTYDVTGAPVTGT